MTRYFHAITICSVFAVCAVQGVHAGADDTRPCTSLVYPGVDGRLVYAPDEDGNCIPDYSYAGYAGGGVALPYVPVRETVWPVPGPDADTIQAAIDRISALPADEHGFRGAVLLKRGWYELDHPITITAGGVVLRGEGQGDTGTILYGLIPGGEPVKTMGRGDLIIVRGAERLNATGLGHRILDSNVPLGARSFRVESSRDFKPGDTVIVRRFTTEAWTRALGFEPGQREHPQLEFDRIVTAVEGDRITVDAPLTCPITAEWGGGEVAACTDNRIEKAGVECLRGISEYDPSVRTTAAGNMDRPNYEMEEYYADENHYWNFISLDNVRNAWVRNVTALHFGHSTVIIGGGCKWVTVQGCESKEPVSRAAGSRRATFSIGGQMCLIQRCTCDKGRHSFFMGSLCGPNVFLNCTATRPYGSSEPHGHLGTGALYDNVVAPITLRRALSDPPRWMSLYGVLWNCEGMYLVQKPTTAQNYAFGHIGIHAMVFNRDLLDYSVPNGHIESWDVHVRPKSLYLKQLADRLGMDAVRAAGYTDNDL